MNDDTITCEGFASCIFAQTIETSSNFISYGSYSSYGAVHVESGDSALCEGDSSCRNISHLETNINSYCRGYRSCFGSTFERTTSTKSNSDLMIRGDESGAFTTLNLNQITDVRANARLSLYNSTINMYSSSGLFLRGFASLYGAKLYCDNNQTCKIECHDFGCYNVLSISGNGTYSINCAYNLVPNILCDGGDNYDSSGIIETVLHELGNVSSGDSNYNSNYNVLEIGFKDVDALSLCSNSSTLLGINCGDAYDGECEYDTLSYINKAICCSSHSGCLDASATLTLTSYLSNTMVSDIYKSRDLIGIYCGATHSCYTSDYASVMQIVDNYNYNYNYDSNIINTTLQNIDFDILCSGYKSCQNLNILGPTNLLCRGSTACERATVDSTQNVFAFGARAIIYGNISNISENVYCLGYESCENVIFSEISGNIYALAQLSLYNTTINNTLGNVISNKIYCISRQSCYKSKIRNVKSVFAIGVRALEKSIISGFRNLYVNGTNALNFSVISSGSTINDTNLNLTSQVILGIDGTNYDKYHVSCSNGDECIINCLSLKSCTHMILNCDGVCYLNCGNYADENGNDCPSTPCGACYPLNSSSIISTTSGDAYDTTSDTSSDATSDATHVTAPAELPSNSPFYQVVPTAEPSYAFGQVTTDPPQNSDIDTNAWVGASTMTTGPVIGSDHEDNDEHHPNAHIDILVLILVAGILCGVFCTIIIISKICVNGFNKKKEFDITQKKIELDIMNKQFSMIMNENNKNKNNNKSKNKQLFDDFKLNGMVNLSATSPATSVANSVASSPGASVHVVEPDLGLVEGIVNIDLNGVGNGHVREGETDHGRQTFSFSGSSNINNNNINMSTPNQGETYRD